MKANIGHIAFMLLCIPLGMSAQQNAVDHDADFYLQLAIRDSHYEQSLHDDEDEADYWKDQKEFEQLLLAKNPTAFQTYINGKHIAYGQHHKKCVSKCTHSDLYLRQASFYAVKGTFSLNSNTAVSSKNTLLIKRVKIPE